MQGGAIVLACLIFTPLLASCATRIDIESARPGPIVTQRPLSTIGPMPEGPVEWRRVDLSIANSKAAALKRWGLTVHVRYSNCVETDFDTDEIYMSGIPLNLLYDVDEQRVPRSGWAQSYLYESDFARYERICLRLVGGNMLGHRTTSSVIQIKP